MRETWTSRHSGGRTPHAAALLAVVGLIALAVALPTAAAARSHGRPATAALQVALTERGAYAGSIDGSLTGPTVSAVRAFQAAAGLVPDGDPGR